MRITDLHMHIVPGVDDGSLNMSMSLDMLLCVAALFMGYANIIGDLLGFGVIGFLIAQWLDS